MARAGCEFLHFGTEEREDSFALVCGQVTGLIQAEAGLVVVEDPREPGITAGEFSPVMEEGFGVRAFLKWGEVGRVS
jgi:hypothetical protein